MEKKGVETKILKMRGKLGKGIGALNKRGRGGEVEPLRETRDPYSASYPIDHIVTLIAL